jgi:hypothetical protein
MTLVLHATTLAILPTIDNISKMDTSTKHYRLYFRFIILFAGILFLTSITRPGYTRTNELINSYIHTVNQIKSFDVTYDIDFFNFLNAGKSESNNLTLAFVETNREAFAVGAGWRIENTIGDPISHTIVFMDWNTFVERSKNKEMYPHGLDYYTFINPMIEGMRFTDLLQDEQSDISPLDLDNGSFSLSNPHLTGYNHIDFWIDSSHGYLLRKLVFYVPNSQTHHINASLSIEVGAFINTDTGIYFPDKIFRNTGEDDGGEEIVINQAASLFNSNLPTGLLTQESLPLVNFQEDGWKCNYPPHALTVAKYVQEQVKKADIRSQKSFFPSKISFAVIFLTLTVPLLFVLMNHIHKGRQHSAHGS